MGILQARILEWIAMPSSSGSSQSRDGTWSPALQADSSLSEPPGSPSFHLYHYRFPMSHLSTMGEMMVEDTNRHHHQKSEISQVAQVSERYLDFFHLSIQLNSKWLITLGNSWQIYLGEIDFHIMDPELRVLLTDKMYNFLQLNYLLRVPVFCPQKEVI